jgi:hypothetical protein
VPVVSVVVGFSRFDRVSSAASSSRPRLLAAPKMDTPAVAEVVATGDGAPPRPGAAPRT